MTNQLFDGNTRREFLKQTGRVAAATTIVAASAPYVHAGEDNTIRVALVGCGGRGHGAAEQALSVQNGPIKLVALADVIGGNLNGVAGAVSRQFGKQFDAAKDRGCVGCDGCQKG